MFRWMLIGVLAIGLVGTGVWGYQEREENQILALTAENNYQRAFHNLAYHIDQLEDHLGTVLAMNTRRQLSPKLAEIWRVTSLAHSDLGQLPLRLMDFSKTEEFLYNVGEFSYKAAIRDLDKDPLTKEEYETVEKLYECASDVMIELRKTQAKVLQQDIHWLEVEKEMMAQNEPLDNAVIDGFHMVNERVQGISETDWGAGMSQMNVLSEEDLGEQLKKEEVIDEEKAKEIALKYLDLEGRDIPIQVAETGSGLSYEAYSLTIDDPDHETNYYMDITKHGGHPVWLLQARDIQEQNISLNEGSEKAQQFFGNNGFKNMQLVDSKQYDNIGIYEFAYLHDNIRVYADSVVVEVALDDGSVIAFEGADYLLNHKEREQMKPNISDDEARKSVHPNVEILEDHLAIIKNDLGKEVLCYEFYGTINNDTYRIFINAQDGEEEKIHKLPEAETVYNFS